MDEDLSINRIRTSSGFSFLYHGSCSQCHHFHIAKRIVLPRNITNETIHYPCDNCGKTLFAAGGGSARLSLASRFTSSSWDLRRLSRTHTNLNWRLTGLDVIDANNEEEALTERVVDAHEPGQRHSTAASSTLVPAQEVHGGLRRPWSLGGIFNTSFRLLMRNRGLQRLRGRIRRPRHLNPRRSTCQSKAPSPEGGRKTEHAPECSPTDLLQVGNAQEMATSQDLPPSNGPPPNEGFPQPAEAASSSRALPNSISTNLPSTDSIAKHLYNRRRELTLKHRNAQRQMCACSCKCSCKMPFKNVDSKSSHYAPEAPASCYLRSTKRHSAPSSLSLGPPLPYPTSVDEMSILCHCAGTHLDTEHQPEADIAATSNSNHRHFAETLPELDPEDPLAPIRRYFTNDSSDAYLYSEPQSLETTTSDTNDLRRSSVCPPAPTPPQRRSSSSPDLIGGMPISALLQLLSDRPQVLQALRIYERALREERRRSSREPSG